MGAALGSAALGFLEPTRLFAQDKRAPALVTVYLRGGWDALNVLIPFRDPRYYQLRPTIAIPPKGDGAVLPLTKRFGLHPALKALVPFYESKLLAPITCVGSPHPTRSHFDAQDFMEYASPGDRTVTEGWLNRYLVATSGPDDDKKLCAVALQRLLPRSLRGAYPVLAVPPDGGNQAHLGAFEELYGDGEKEMGAPSAEETGKRAVVQTGRDTIAQLRRFRELTDGKAAGGARYPGSRFAKGLQRISALIKAQAGLKVAAMDYTGWDHHADEGGNDGKMAGMLADVGDSLAAFMTDLGEHQKDVMVLVMSEFGRTARENGNTGTDHGRGGLMLALGGAVKGGRIYGKWAGLEDSALADKRDLPVLVDYRDVFAEVLDGLLGFGKPTKAFFPAYRPSLARAMRFVNR